jgi:hypothetical protein
MDGSAPRPAVGRLGSEHDAGGGYSGRRGGVAVGRQVAMAAAPGQGPQVVDGVGPACGDRGALAEHPLPA